MISTGIHTKTAATANVLTTAEAKQHLKVDFADADDNTYIDSLVKSAQRTVEAYTNRVFNDTTFYFYLSAFPSGGIVLPFNPVKSITSIKYYDGDNNEQTWADTNYFYNIYEEPCKIQYVGGSVPGITETKVDAITVEFVAGYTSPDAIPDEIDSAVRLLMTDLYEHRTDMPREKFTAWKSLAYQHKVFHEPMENQ